MSYGQWQALEESHVLSGLAGYQIEAEVNWRGPESSVSLIPLIVTSNFFDVLGTPAALGRTFTAGEAAISHHPDVAVISHGFWQRRLGGDADIVGRSLTFNGRPYTVLGVLPADYTALPGYGVAPEVYLPLSRELMPDLYEPRAAIVELFGRLGDRQTMAQGRAALTVAGHNASNTAQRSEVWRRHAVLAGRRRSKNGRLSHGRSVLRAVARGSMPDSGDRVCECGRAASRPFDGAQT